MFSRNFQFHRRDPTYDRMIFDTLTFETLPLEFKTYSRVNVKLSIVSKIGLADTVGTTKAR